MVYCLQTKGYNARHTYSVYAQQDNYCCPATCSMPITHKRLALLMSSSNLLC